MTRSQSAFRTLACSVLLTLVAGRTIAYACDLPAHSTPESTCVVMPFKTRPGVWLDLETADTLRSSWLLVPELKLQLEKYDQIEKERAAEMADLRAVIAFRRDVSDTLKGIIETTARQAREARAEAAASRNELGRWYRSPWLWGGVGVLLGAVTAKLISSR